MSLAETIQRLSLRGIAALPNFAMRALAGTPIRIDGLELDPMLQVLWKQGRTQPSLAGVPPGRARLAARAGMALIDHPGPPVAREAVSVPGPAGSIPCRLFHPASQLESRPGGEPGGAPPTIVYFHQGGYVIGGLDDSAGFCASLAAGARAEVLSVDYRLAPEHPFPAAFEDSLAATRWALDRAGASGARVAVAGDSAGGGLAAAVAATLADEAHARGVQQPLALHVPIYPWVDAAGRTASYDSMAQAWPLDAPMMDWFVGLAFRAREDAADPRVSPLRATEFAGRAPALVVVAGFDPLREEGLAYAARLREAGVPVELIREDRLTHAFCAMGAVPACRAARERLAWRVGEMLGSRPATNAGGGAGGTLAATGARERSA